ncbi:hypothetical protein NL676_012004 [Syzygium grande]|nr:hypothetical protein NL676_012004 [Syzygium grande]
MEPYEVDLTREKEESSGATASEEIPLAQKIKDIKHSGISIVVFLQQSTKKKYQWQPLLSQRKPPSRVQIFLFKL